MDGFGVLTTLRQDPVTAIIPFILSLPRLARLSFVKVWIWEQISDQALYGRGITGGVAARLEKQAALRAVVRGTVPERFRVTVVDTLQPAAPKSIPSLPT